MVNMESEVRTEKKGQIIARANNEGGTRRSLLLKQWMKYSLTRRVTTGNTDIIFLIRWILTATSGTKPIIESAGHV